jgi:hypothetical protein
MVGIPTTAGRSSAYTLLGEDRRFDRHYRLDSRLSVESSLASPRSPQAFLLSGRTPQWSSTRSVRSRGPSPHHRGYQNWRPNDGGSFMTFIKIEKNQRKHSDRGWCTVFDCRQLTAKALHTVAAYLPNPAAEACLQYGGSKLDPVE